MTAALADLLSEHRAEILARFAARVRLGPFPSETLSNSVLLDGLPDFFDQVRGDLGGAARIDDLLAAVNSGAEHGQQRQELGFNVVEVAREWAIVRAVVLELIIEGSGRIDLEDYQTLSRHVSAAEISAIQEHVLRTERERDALTAKHVGFFVHDLRNQLTGATAALSWMCHSPGSTEPARRVLEASLAELTRLLDQELTLSRLTALRSGTEVHAETIVVADLLALVENESAALAAVRHVAITDESEAGLSVRGDPRLLRSALVNLVGNAVKFTRPDTTVRIRARATGARVEISVSDACGGIADATQETLFAEHQQVGVDRSGFGLGLAICRQAVEAHRGAVTVRNQPGVGCTFVIALPATDASAVSHLE